MSRPDPDLIDRILDAFGVRERPAGYRLSLYRRLHGHRPMPDYSGHPWVLDAIGGYPDREPMTVSNAGRWDHRDHVHVSPGEAVVGGEPYVGAVTWRVGADGRPLSRICKCGQWQFGEGDYSLMHLAQDGTEHRDPSIPGMCRKLDPHGLPEPAEADSERTPPAWEKRRKYIRALGDLIEACNREMDLAQTGAPLDDPRVPHAYERANTARREYRL